MGALARRARQLAFSDRVGAGGVAEQGVCPCEAEDLRELRAAAAPVACERQGAVAAAFVP